MHFLQTFSARNRARAAVLGLAAVAVALLVLSSWGPFRSPVLGDNDDLLRLKQVRDLLDGKSWFDLNEPRIDPPHGLDSHWSRLIDGGIAGLVLLFRLFAPHDAAELFARAIWPLLWVVPTVLLAAAAARAIAGPGRGDAAAVLAALYLLVCWSPFFQFRVGRIDHHNLQNMLAVALMAASLGLDGSRRSGRLVGAAIAGALAVGFESLPFAVTAGAVAAFRFVRYGHREEMLGFCEAAGGGAVFLFLLQTPSTVRFVPACDALAINSTAAAAGAALVLGSAAAFGREWPATARAGATALAGAVAAAAFFGPEPACLAGPFGRADAALATVWHSEIAEQEPLRPSLSRHDLFPYVALPFLFAAGTAVAAAMTGRARPEKIVVALIFLLVAGVMALGMVRHVPYPMLVAAALVGGAGASLPRSGRLSPVGLTAATVLALFAIPWTGAVLVHRAAGVFGPVATVDTAAGMMRGCGTAADFDALVPLPPGLILAPLKIGTPIVVLTAHSVLSTPYHRTSTTIVKAEAALRGDEAGLRSLVLERGVDYLAVCASENYPEGSPAAALAAGSHPEWTTPVVESGALRVYRVRPVR